jgi:hypothetical protein
MEFFQKGDTGLGFGAEWWREDALMYIRGASY